MPWVPSDPLGGILEGKVPIPESCTDRLIEPSFTFASPQHDTALQSITAATQIWVEPVKRGDDRKHYTTGRGLLQMTWLGGPDGEILGEGMGGVSCPHVVLERRRNFRA